ncbi:ABC transporter substrate-binding protein [Paenibacillus sp. KS-LC4]|uniref:ABC transporter substrate-binding protein n=1 Tax=Paenibacillus sp. KS-LC4 TaxID=2979727 RepID=UPI0030D59485
MSTYRHFFLSVALAAIIAVLSACGNSSGSEQSSSPTASPVSTASASSAETSSEPQALKVTHAFGTTELPAAPKRIASINLEDMLLALDVPIVFGMSIGEGYYLNEKLKEQGATLEIWGDSLNLEAIVAAQPDLIIASTAIMQEGYDNLSKIAPTIVYDREDWRNSLVAIGRALDMEDQALAFISAYDKQTADAKASLGQLLAEGKSAAFIRMNAKDFRVYFPNYVDEKTQIEWPTYPGVLYNELGMKLDPTVEKWHQEQPHFQNATISLEMLPELQADYLFVTLGGAGSTDEEIRQAKESFSSIEQSSVWKSVPAVKADHVIFVNARHWISSGPLANSMKMNDVVAELGSSN